MKKILIVLAAAVIMPALLILTVYIPERALKQHTLKSAQFLCDNELFGYVNDKIEGSCIDRYADSILLNIAYHLDKENPLRSVMLSAYYFTPDHEENENLLMAVEGDLGITRQYLRYWHGSSVIVRPLLAVTDIRGMYAINAVVLVILFALLIFMFAKRRDHVLIIAFCAATVMTRAWYVPLSLEYTWTFMIMLICSVISIILCKKNKDDLFGVFFIITGMAVAFFDFLTTETITLLVPLLVILWMKHIDGKDSPRADKNTGFFNQENVRLSIKSSVSWLAGYVGMWSAKWILCSIIMKENAFPYVTEHVAERLTGETGIADISTGRFLAGAITRNIGCLFPLGYGAAGVIGFIAIILIAAYIGFVYRRDGSDAKFICLIAIIGFVPYIRYLILHNHSYVHCFFTYRAQYATVTAIVLIIGELLRRKTDQPK